MSFAEFGHVYALQDQVKAEDKVVVETTKSPIALGLGATDALIGNTKQKPDLVTDRAFAKENITTDETVIISPVRGDYRESNPN